jgi:hypothetical protein
MAMREFLSHINSPRFKDFFFFASHYYFCFLGGKMYMGVLGFGGKQKRSACSAMLDRFLQDQGGRQTGNLPMTRSCANIQDRFFHTPFRSENAVDEITTRIEVA